MIVYCSSDYRAEKVYSNLQKIRKGQTDFPNVLSCPAVRDSWHNVFMFSPTITSTVSYEPTSVFRDKDLPITQNRKPHFVNTNIFDLESSTYFLSEKPLNIKVTAPYFHKVEYQNKGTFIGGVFDIGRWFRPIESEIITWSEKGQITFVKDEPLFYVEFLTDLPVTLKPFKINPIIATFAINLVNSPFQIDAQFQGSLESRYQAFENSDYRKGLIEEIKAAVIPNE